MKKHNILGGRAKKAPYESTHARIPEPLKEIVSLLADTYRHKVESYEDINDSELIAECLQAVTDKQQIVLKAVNEFIDSQRNDFGKTSSQKNKEFSTGSRSWDNFNKFKTMAEDSPDKLNLK